MGWPQERAELGSSVACRKSRFGTPLDDVTPAQTQLYGKTRISIHVNMQKTKSKIEDQWEAVKLELVLSGNLARAMDMTSSC